MRKVQIYIKTLKTEEEHCVGGRCRLSSGGAFTFSHSFPHLFRPVYLGHISLRVASHCMVVGYTDTVCRSAISQFLFF